MGWPALSPPPPQCQFISTRSQDQELGCSGLCQPELSAGESGTEQITAAPFPLLLYADNSSYSIIQRSWAKSHLSPPAISGRCFATIKPQILQKRMLKSCRNCSEWGNTDMWTPSQDGTLVKTCKRFDFPFLQRLWDAERYKAGMQPAPFAGQNLFCVPNQADTWEGRGLPWSELLQLCRAHGLCCSSLSDQSKM